LFLVTDYAESALAGLPRGGATGRHHQSRASPLDSSLIRDSLAGKRSGLPTVQLLLGHSDLKATSIYLHLSERHLKAAGTPLDKVELSSLDQVKRSRKLHKR
jgi:integrase